MLRASVDVARGQFAGAKTAARRAIDREPLLEKGWWVLVTVSLHEKKHADTARLLADIETKLGLQIVDLTQLPEYAEFVKSAEYRAVAEEALDAVS